MFCPKCGGQNSDDLAYCRECGENLKIISQVMKGHAPVALASKLDAVFQRKNERLRREAIWWTGTGLVTAIWAFVSGPLIPFGNEWTETVSSILIPLFFLYHGAGNYLAYRRSLELEAGPITNEKLIAAADTADDPKRDQGAQIFCAKCGTPNSEIKQFCASCGFRLVFEPRGMEKYLPRFVIRWLDRRIRWNEWFLAVPRQGWRILVGGLSMVVLAVSMGILGKTSLAALYAFLALSGLINSGWDYLTYLRTVKPEFVAVSETYESTWYEFRAFTRKPEVKFKLWATVIFLLLSFAAPFVYESGAFFFPLATLTLAALLMWNLKQFRAENRKRRMENGDELPTRELSSNETAQLDSNLDEAQQIAPVDEFRNPTVGDTVRFASLPGSVTEDTTKHLTALSEPLPEESLTTGELNNGDD